MFLSYQNKTLHARVNTWLGTALLVTVGLWAGLVMWQVATGGNAVVQAFTKLVQQRTVLPD